MPELRRFAAHQSIVDLGYSQIDDALVVYAAGHVDFNTAAHVRDEILSRVEARHDRLVLYLEEVGLLDSAGIGALAVVTHHMAKSGVRVAVVTTSRHVRRLLKIAALDREVDLHSSVAEALAGDQEPDDAS